MANSLDLKLLNFSPHGVTAKTLDIIHDNPHKLGPFCRLTVSGDFPELPGVYAWEVFDTVMYVGHSNCLRQVVDGVRMARAYNDYTYVPASKTTQGSSPRVRINGNLNRLLRDGATVRWWCRTCDDRVAAVDLERKLYEEWKPAWNLAIP